MGSWLGHVKSKSWVHGLVMSNQSHGFMAWSGQIKVMGSWLGQVKSKSWVHGLVMSNQRHYNWYLLLLFYSSALMSKSNY
jgi:hypothetical protein